MYLKIAIMNNSGNVGKSMTCDTFLKPRISGSETIKIETINSDGSLDPTISAKDVKQVFQRIDSTDVALIDVGASNIEAFMSNLQKLSGAHEDIDYFIVPTTPKPKQQTDTISTINSLLDLGVNESQIIIIFNFYDDDFTVQQQYPVIFESNLSKILKLNSNKNIFTISESPIFDLIGEMGKTFNEIAADKRDFKALLRATEDKEERAIISYNRTAKRLADGFTKELDETFLKMQSAFKSLASN